MVTLTLSRELLKELIYIHLHDNFHHLYSVSIVAVGLHVTTHDNFIIYIRFIIVAADF